VAEIRYRYALDLNDNIVDIRDNPTRKKIYRCLNCGRELRPVLGRSRRHHFRHLNTHDHLCKPESYLHKLAKLTFFKLYQQCVREGQPFEVEFVEQRVCNRLEAEYGVTCDIGDHYRRVDLTQHFPYAQLEARDGDFIPDVLLTNDHGEKLYFEVAVTHKSSDRKKDAGYRVIELDVSSESDIQPILDRHIVEGRHARFFHFKRIRKGDFCGGSCVDGLYPGTSEMFQLAVFVVHKSGKCILTQVSSVKAAALSNTAPYVKFLPVSQSKTDVFLREMEAAYRAGVRVKNCFLCRYHAENRSWRYHEGNPIFCKYLKKPFPSNHAAECEAYRPDEKVFPGQPQSQSPWQNRTISIKEDSRPRRYQKDRQASSSQDTTSPAKEDSRLHRYQKDRQASSGQNRTSPAKEDSRPRRQQENQQAEKQRAQDDDDTPPLQVGTCIFCGQRTTDWWWYQGETGECKCRDCYKKGLY